MVAKILTNFSIAAIAVLGGRLRASPSAATRRTAHRARTGSSCATSATRRRRSRSWALSDATIEAKWFFQFVFCAVSLAIVWGTTLERIKFGVYVIYAVVFSALIYPIGSHWVFGGGWLQTRSSASACRTSPARPRSTSSARPAPSRCCCTSGRGSGKYGTDGKPRAIPGHNMPLFGLGVLILWLGWFGFNPGSTLNALGRPLRRGRARHEPRRRGRRARRAGHRRTGQDEDARHRHGRQRRDRRARRDHGARRATSSSWAAIRHRPRRRRHRRRSACYAIDKQARRPGRRAHRARPVRASGARSPAASSRSPRLAPVQRASATAGPGLHRARFTQLGVQALGVVVVFAFVFVASLRDLLA